MAGGTYSGVWLVTFRFSLRLKLAASPRRKSPSHRGNAIRQGIYHPRAVVSFASQRRRIGATRKIAPQRPDCVPGHIGLELANVALTRRDLNRSLPGVREKSLVTKMLCKPKEFGRDYKKQTFPSSSPLTLPRSQVSERDWGRWKVVQCSS